MRASEVARPAFVSLAIFLLAAAVGVPATAAGLRVLGPSDLLRIEELGEVALSPDGQYLAYVLKRSKAAAASGGHFFGHTRLQGNDRADVWLVAARGGEPRKLTDGESRGCGYWYPTWSPDGRRLAMLSTRDGNVRVWVWEQATGALRQLEERGVDLQFGENPMVWLDAGRLAFPVLPAGEHPIYMDLEVRAATRPMDLWPRSLRGREAVVSVLRSGVAPDFEKRPRGALVVFDFRSGVREVATGLGFRDLVLSHDGRRLAFLKRVGGVVPEPDKLIQHGRPHLYGIYEPWVVSVEDRIDAAVPLPADDVFPGSLRWAPDGGELAMVGRARGDAASPDLLRLLRCTVVSPACVAAAEGLEALASPAQLAPAVWSNEGLLILTRERSAAEGGGSRGRRDWWAVGRDGTPRNLTGSMKAVPGRLVPEPGGNSFLGVAGGRLWRIPVAGTGPENVERGLPSQVDSIVWPPAAATTAAREVIVSSGRGDESRLFKLGPGTERAAELTVPAPGAAIAAYSPQAGVAVLTKSDASGTRAWLSRPAFERHAAIVETNTFLAGITGGSVRRVEYKGLDGNDLAAWVLLPPGYEEGRRYPMVVWVYAGSMAGQEPSRLTDLFNPSPLNLQLLASGGYVVLIPSMPLSSDLRPADPYQELTKGVLPAVDRLVELGIADGDRVGVMGQSFGGYSTYGLITQTNRFRAAVALAGISDLLSMYGQFDPRFRYEPYAHEMLFMMSIAETGQLGLGNPPWKDFWRYVRNSPLFYVERVSTPVMIIQGDMDFVPMEQGEMFFTALQRQGKRAELVRYWGEGHVLEAPANIEDMWERIHAWFDEFLKRQESRASS